MDGAPRICCNEKEWVGVFSIMELLWVIEIPLPSPIEPCSGPIYSCEEAMFWESTVILEEDQAVCIALAS